MIDIFHSSATLASESLPEEDSVLCIGVEVPSQAVIETGVVIDYINSGVPNSYGSQNFGGPEEEI